MNSITNNNSLIGILNLFKEKINRDIECALPCIVTGVTSRKTVNVKPSIKMIMADFSEESRAEINNIPIFNYSTNSFAVSLPVKAGDTGWLVACDRDISKFLDDKQESAPHTSRSHTFADSFFIPDGISNFTVKDENKDALVIQSSSGEVCIAVKNDEVTINGKVKIDKDGNITAETLTAKEVTVSNVKLSSHVHAGVTAGGATTQPMIPT